MMNLSQSDQRALKDFLAKWPTVQRVMSKVISQANSPPKTIAPRQTARPRPVAPDVLILGALRKAKGGIAAAAVVRETQLSLHTVKTELQKLLGAKKVGRSGETKDTLWFIERRGPNRIERGAKPAPAAAAAQ